MAQVVKLKRSSTAGNVPTSGQMVAGELAMNTGDGKLYLRDDSDVRPIVTVDNEVTGSINLTGDITASNLSIDGFADVSASLASAVAGGDNLGNHTATQNLNMGGNAITNVGNVDGVDVSTLKSDFDTLENTSKGRITYLYTSSTSVSPNVPAGYITFADNIVDRIIINTSSYNGVNLDASVSNDYSSFQFGEIGSLLTIRKVSDGSFQTYKITDIATGYDSNPDQVAYQVDNGSFSIKIESGSISNGDEVEFIWDKSAGVGGAYSPTEGFSTKTLAGFYQPGYNYLDMFFGKATDAEFDGSPENLSGVESSASFTDSRYFLPAISQSESLTLGGLTVNGTITGTINTSSITDFPTEVSRSAAEAGFGSGGGGGGGNVSNTGTPVNDQIAVWTDSTTIEGTTKLTFENSTITVHSSNADGTGIEIYGGVYPTVTSWISPIGVSNKMNFGDGTSGHIFDFLNNKIAFDGDSTNTYIQANTDTPEDLEIHADQDIILAADNAVVIGAVTDVEDRISSYRVVLQSNCYLSQNTKIYLPFNSLSEQSNFNYISLTPAAANGQLISITVWPQSGGGSTIAGLHVNSNATATATDTQTLSTGAPTTFTFSGATFSQNDELSFSIDPTSNPNGFSAQIILEYDY